MRLIPDIWPAWPLGGVGKSRPVTGRSRTYIPGMEVLSRPSELARFTVDVDTLTIQEWDHLVGEFADASWEQTACWVEGRWGKRSSHLVVRRDGVPVAGARVVVFRLPGLRSGLAYMKFGPFYRRLDEPADPDLYRRVITALVDEFCVRRGHCLSILPRPTPGRYEEECATLTTLGFSVRRPRLDPNRYLVDPTLGHADRLASLDQKWRYNLRLGMRNGITCRIVDDDEGHATFMALYARMMARKGIGKLDPVELLPQLATRLTDRMRPRVVLAYHGAVPVAGAVVALCGDTAFYMFGASDDAALPIKAGYVLQGWIVEWLSTAGVRWYDLGGEVSAPGLRQFKKGLVGRRGTTVATLGEFERFTSWRAGQVGTAIHRLRTLRRALRAR